MSDLSRPSSSRKILIFLLGHCESKTGKTTVLSRREIADECDLKPETVKKCIHRLIQKKVLKLVETFHSSKAGGSSYLLSKEAKKSIEMTEDDLAESRSQNRFQSDSTGHVSLFVRKNKTNEQTGLKESDLRSGAREKKRATPLDSTPLRRLQLAVERLHLDDEYKISCNDLAAAYEKSDLTIDDFLTSLEHLSFYLRSNESDSIRNPKAWVFKRLGRGYFGPPADFVSWEAQQETEKLQAARKRATELRRLQQERFEAEFEAWKLEQTTASVEEILRKIGPHISGSMSSPATQAFLRKHFAEATDRVTLLEMSDKPEGGREGP